MKVQDVRPFTDRNTSGLSHALRLPPGPGLEPAMALDLRVEDGPFCSSELVARPMRKFNIDRVWGSATALNPADPADRLFEGRP